MTPRYKPTMEANFIKEVSRIINHIAQAIEENDDECDVDINGDILNIITKDGTYVINRQTPLKEIWLSSPVSGPYHFAFDGVNWSSNAGDELFDVLSRDLGIRIEGM